MRSDSAPGYRRRVRWPILVFLAVLAIATVVIWTQALKPKPIEEAGCNTPGPAPTRLLTGTGTATTAPTSPQLSTAAPQSSTAVSTTLASTTLGTFIEPAALKDTRPADPAKIPLRVLNASTVTGQAKTVTDELRAAGFANVGQQANDPLYPAADLRCYGEIRYGPAGLSEARTTLLVAPCAQLVLDGRADNSVDLSLGKRYIVEAISADVRAELEKIAQAAAPPPVIEGQTLALRTPAAIPPLPDRSHCPA